MSGKEEKTNGPEILPRRPKCWQRRKEAGPGKEEGRGGADGRREREQNQSLLCDRPERVRVREALSKSEPRDRDETIL